MRNESEVAQEVGRVDAAAAAQHHRPVWPWPRPDRTEWEHACWDPKDGELCLNRVKSDESLMEARSDSDVQIDRQIWV